MTHLWFIYHCLLLLRPATKTEIIAAKIAWTLKFTLYGTLSGGSFLTWPPSAKISSNHDGWYGSIFQQWHRLDCQTIHSGLPCKIVKRILETMDRSVLPFSSESQAWTISIATVVCAKRGPGLRNLYFFHALSCYKDR